VLEAIWKMIPLGVEVHVIHLNCIAGFSANENFFLKKENIGLPIGLPPSIRYMHALAVKINLKPPS
jgi:hypothetical protein